MRALTLQAVKRTVSGLSIILKALPIPDPFKSAVVGIPDAVLEIIKILEAAKGNMEDAEALVVYMATVTDKTLRPLDPINTPSTAKKRIEEFLDVLQQIKQGIRDLVSHKSRWRRIVDYDRDASTLAAMKKSVDDAITYIQLETAMATNQEVDLISRKQDIISQEQDLIGWNLDQLRDAQLHMGQKQDRLLYEMTAVIKEQEVLYRGQQTMIRQQQEAEIARLIASLGTQDTGSSKKPPCLDDTQVSLLKMVKEWIELRPDNGPRALCLKGSAGIGKSSVASTVAGTLRESLNLGAEFYFTADQQERNEAAIVVLARQLASWSEGKLRFEIAEAIHKDPEIVRRAPEVQFQQLIQGPLESLAGDVNGPNVPVFLDGLDECNEDYACRLLTAVGKGLDRLPVIVRVVLTSRPVPHLLAFYTSEPMKSQLRMDSLDDGDISQRKQDIRKYYEVELPGRVKMWVKDSVDWPGEEKRTKLVELSQGLWIHATTVTLMLADSAIRDPERQLEAVLSPCGDTSGNYGRNTHLYAVYSTVLNRACPPNASPDLLALFRDVLGTVLAVQVPVNIHTLASLLYTDKSKLNDYTHHIRTRVLAYLQAVLTVPGVEEADPSRDERPIRFIHKSFQDYLTEESQSEHRFYLNPADMSRKMTVRCLTFPGLKRNICHLNPSLLNSEVDSLSGSDIGVGIVPADDDEKDGVKGLSGIERRVRHHVSAGLQYACEQWPNHITREDPESDKVGPLLEEFVQMHLLHWVEVLSLLGKTKELIESIELVQSWLKARPSPRSPEPLKSAETIPKPSHRPSPSAVRWLEMTTVNMYRRFQELAVDAASYSTLFHSDNRAHRLAVTLESFKLAALPSQATVPPRPPVTPPKPHFPTPVLLQELKYFVREFLAPISTSSTHIYHSALPFTPRESPLSIVYGHLAEGGPCVSRGRLQRWLNLEDHGLSGKSWCIAWSPDGKTIVSGSDDNTLRFWDASTGAPIGEPLEGHISAVRCAAWSPDGKTIVSGSNDKSLRFWNASTRAPIGEPLWGHTHGVLCAAWSPDGKTIVSGSDDKTLRFWNASTGAPIGEPLYGHTEGVLATLRRALEGHNDSVQCTAWSPDGKTIVSRSDDNTFRFWSAPSGLPISEPLLAHAGEVGCIAWSPDGKAILSSFGYFTICLWDPFTGEPVLFGQRWPDSHTHSVYRLAFSPDLRHIVSASADNTLCLWDVETGTLAQRPVSQPLKASSLEFSLDGKYVLSEDKEVQTVWDVAGEGDELPMGPPARSAVGDTVNVLTIDESGWLLDLGGKRMFWVPVVLRPQSLEFDREGIRSGRILVNGNILTMEIPTVPIIDISAYVSKDL
ncbi:hypothetical protein FRB96_005581 [Tulasnella sp. 330]|nr:hypothetical protein FRB96_005581 [Tulasnella sp. 330]